MLRTTILCVPRTPAIRHAGEYLSEMGLQVTTVPAPDIRHVLLPVPSFTAGDGYLAHLLSELPDDVIISGGNLNCPLLRDYVTVDFLRDPYYLAENAAITADCTLQILENKLASPLSEYSVLITGWGRISKCLCRLLEKNGVDITVAVRKEADRAMIRALGWHSISIEAAAKCVSEYDVIINTVPAMVLPDIHAHDNALILELASIPGISGANIMDCRGMPAKMAPDRSGKLIAETFLRLSLSGEVTL